MDTTPRLTGRHIWLLPAILIIGLAAALPALNLAASADPQGHLRDLPVALVVDEQAASTAPGPAARVGEELDTHVGPAIDLVRMDRDELAQAMREDRVAGAVVIPRDFEAGIASLLP